MPYQLTSGLLVLTFITPTSNAQTNDTWPLTRCQQIQKQINYYSDLRKRGGSAEQMEQWKQQREKYKEDFDRGNCKQWGKQLDT